MNTLKCPVGLSKATLLLPPTGTVKKIDPVGGSYATRRMLADVNTNTSEQTLNELIMS